MNHPVYYSNKDSDDIASGTWPDLLCAIENYPYPSVPQNTYSDQVFAPGYPTVGSYVPDFNVANPYPPVPQSTHPDRVFTPGYPTVGSHVPDFNAADYAGFSLPPATEMGAFVNLPPLDLPPQADFTNQVSSRCVGVSASTYPNVPQDFLNPWSRPALCMFLSCICHDLPYSPDANPKSPST